MNKNDSDFYLSRITCAHLRPKEICQAALMLGFMMGIGAFIGIGAHSANAAGFTKPPAAQIVLPEGMDANHDGAVMLAEYRAFFDKQFKTMDLNGDGRITKPEFLQGIDAQIKRDPALAGHGER